MVKIIKKIRLVAILAAGLYLVQCESNDMNLYNSGTSGKGGSMAKFTINCNNLFVIDNQNLKVINVEDARNPVFTKELTVGMGIETVFPYKDNLFIGASDGMYIYNLFDCSNPQLNYLTKFAHVLSCDPVVANDSFAYVTLRSSGNCRSGMTTSDELNIIDISTISNPQLIASYPMTEPYGLGVDGKYLFICHGDYGFSVHDVSKSKDIQLMSYFTDIHAWDCILYQKRLLLTGKDGFFQYDYSNIDSIKLLSLIPKGQ